MTAGWQDRGMEIRRITQAEAVRDDAARYAPIIKRTQFESLPLISGTLDPPDPRYVTDYGHTESEIVEFAIDSLNKRLRAIGINLAA